MKTIFALKWIIFIWLLAIGFSTYLYDYRKENIEYFRPKPRECYIVDVVNGRNNNIVVYTYNGKSYEDTINSTDEYVKYKTNIGKKIILSLSPEELQLREDGDMFSILYILLGMFWVLAVVFLFDESANPDLDDIGGYITIITLIIIFTSLIFPFCPQ